MYQNQLKYNQKYPYSSTGKERDSETGFSYFGARYYDSDLMTGWLSVDPMADKYPGVSPYTYCAWNPIKLVDPDGRMIGDYYDAQGNYLGTDGIEDKKIYQLKENYRPIYENTEVNWGGTLSEKHYTEIKDKSNYLGEISNVFVTGDKITDSRICELHPAIRMLARDFILEANEQYDGDFIRISQGFRTYDEQDALYAKGRTIPGNIVTNAKGGISNHNFGLAFDIVGIKNGKVDWDLNWNAFSILGESKGFTWGGNWKKIPDKPHFEKTFGYSTAQLRNMTTPNHQPKLKP